MYMRRTIELALLTVSVIASVATSPVRQETELFWNDTWVVENLFDGQTAVPLDHEIKLTIGYQDFDPSDEEGEGYSREQAELALQEIALHSPLKGPVQLDIEVYQDYSLIKAPLAQNTDYVLELDDLSSYLRVARQLPPPIHFSTTEGPKVTGLWRNDDTLIIAFSEPMDQNTMNLSQISVDVLWQDKDLHSVASDLNLADFVWETRGNLFMFAPVTILGGAVWVKVAGEVQGLSGGTLDGNRNGSPGEAEDDYLSEPVLLGQLPACFSRDDVPTPCINETDVLDRDTGWW
ncbi:MAG: hypothetical protein HN348_25960 [Proteobacteria bacterium]|nr:hypothetical protein [Pseudomonadota bacterium]